VASHFGIGWDDERFLTICSKCNGRSKHKVGGDSAATCARRHIDAASQLHLLHICTFARLRMPPRSAYAVSNCVCTCRLQLRVLMPT
jgi:hypothetical protein